VLSGEETNTNLIVFCLTRSGHKPYPVNHEQIGDDALNGSVRKLEPILFKLEQSTKNNGLSFTITITLAFNLNFLNKNNYL
jgi:hypothetical protein